MLSLLLHLQKEGQVRNSDEVFMSTKIPWCDRLLYPTDEGRNILKLESESEYNNPKHLTALYALPIQDRMWNLSLHWGVVSSILWRCFKINCRTGPYTTRVLKATISSLIFILHLLSWTLSAHFSFEVGWTLLAHVSFEMAGLGQHTSIFHSKWPWLY